MTLDREQLERCAESRAGRLLVDAKDVAAYLGVEPSYVYEHAHELGARRLGDGPKARLRFSLAEIDERLTACSDGRESTAPEPASLSRSRRRRGRSLGTTVELLPIRGSRPAHPARAEIA